MSASQLTQFADLPLSNPDEDRLGYAAYADDVARHLAVLRTANGLVVAVTGAWGSGKSTFLAFLRFFLQHHLSGAGGHQPSIPAGAHQPATKEPIFVEFNPWWFSGQEDLIRHFFDQLQAILRAASVTRRLTKAAETAADMIATYSSLIALVPVPGADQASKILAQLKPEEPTVPALKAQIGKELASIPRRIVVIIDDVDRLTAPEIRQVFRMLKTVADFPNILYLVAFDSEIVVKALEEEQHLPGEAYLEKIVQVPIELPQLDRATLSEWLWSNLTSLFGPKPTPTSDPDADARRWASLYLGGVDHFVTTPRAVARLTNTLAFTYAGLHGQVDPFDFTAIESLRLFVPQVYDFIRTHGDAFTDVPDEAIPAAGPAMTGGLFKQIHATWQARQESSDERQAVERILGQIFPRLWKQGIVHIGALWAPMSLGANSDLGIRNPNAFPRYFRFTLPTGALTQREFETLLASADDATRLAEALKQLVMSQIPGHPSRLPVVLDQLRLYVEQENVKPQRRQATIQALFQAGDELLAGEAPVHTRSVFRVGTDALILAVIMPLLGRYTRKAERLTLLKTAIADGAALSLAVRTVEWLGAQGSVRSQSVAAPDGDGPGTSTRQHAPDGVTTEEVDSIEERYLQQVSQRLAAMRLLTPDGLRDLKKLVVQKIEAAATEGRLAAVPLLPGVLAAWYSWAGREAVRTWVLASLANDVAGPRLLGRLLVRAPTGGQMPPGESEGLMLPPDSFAPYIEAREFADRARHLLKAQGINERLALAIKRLVDQHGSPEVNPTS